MINIKYNRIFQSEKGIWYIEEERNGKLYGSSLHTRDERKANKEFEKHKIELENFLKLRAEGKV